jgi:uncharacterized protein YcbK (DUF882 family)
MQDSSPRRTTSQSPSYGSPSERGMWSTLLVVGVAALGLAQFTRAVSPAPTEPFAALARGDAHLSANATPNAFGASREVRLRFALPGGQVEFPLGVGGDLSALTYEWVSARDTVVAEPPRPLSGPAFVAPSHPGFYRLAIVRGLERHVIAEPMVAVMVPFTQKIGSTLNGYRIGTYLAERLGHHDHPPGFVEVGAGDVDLRVSKHLRLGDFLTHDQQEDVWPKYVALNPRLLDKLELVLAQIGAKARVARASYSDSDVALDVHSGYRTPAHNQGVWRAASDSRHQYGDAADVAIDADGDGRVTLRDEALVATAVDQVEAEHPDLVGGLGLYTSGQYRTPYVHIDTRGTRSRWKG